MSSFADLLRRELPQTWGEPFTQFFGAETVVRPSPWQGPPPDRWIEGTWRVGDQRRRLWLGTRRELAFAIAGRLTLMPASRLDALLEESDDPPAVVDAFGEWGNLAIAYLADLFRQAFGPEASAVRACEVAPTKPRPRGSSLDFTLSWRGGAGGPVRLIIE